MTNISRGRDGAPPLILDPMDVYEAITTRRSAPKTDGRVPDKASIERLIRAAMAAPNHHLTEPWRFIVLTGGALSKLGDAWAAGEERAGGDPEKVREKALRAPVILTVVERPNRTNPKVVEIEEHHAIGAAIQNILLAAHAAGLAAMIRTGPAARLNEVRDYLGVADDEIIAGFVYLGYPLEGFERKAPRKSDPDELTEWRGWE